MSTSEQKSEENSTKMNISEQSSFSLNNDEEKKQPRGWIIVQQKIKQTEEIRISYTIRRITETFTKQGFKMRIINSRDIDIYLTNYERKSILINGVITKLPDFVLSRTGASTSFSTLAIYRHLERLGMFIIMSLISFWSMMIISL